MIGEGESTKNLARQQPVWSYGSSNILYVLVNTRVCILRGFLDNCFSSDSLIGKKVLLTTT